jgi:non-heme chloroperoxidase
MGYHHYYSQKYNFCIALFLLLLILVNFEARSQHVSSFDSLGPNVQSLKINNKTIHYIDDGEKTDIPVVFISGLGTSVRAIRLLDFLRTFREELGLRLISIERNGFGQTQFNPTSNMTSHSREIIEILEHLGIKNFSLFAISGGGPYAAKLASIIPERIESIHMAATLPVFGTKERCIDGQIANIYKDIFQYPMKYFVFPADSPVHIIEGFQDTAFDEAARAFYIKGPMADLAPLDHELSLYCDEKIIDTSNVKVPLYIYAGTSDPLIDSRDIEDWNKYYPNANIIKRVYSGEGHDVQYRHLDQILIDIKYKSNKILICDDKSDKILNFEDLNQGNKYYFGLCIWQESNN